MRYANYYNDHCFFQGICLLLGLNIHVFPGGYDYRSVEVSGTEYTDVALPLIYMAAGLHNIGIYNSYCRP